MKFLKLSIIIPVFNERNTVTSVVEKVMAQDVPLDKEIIIVNDGSTDGSGEIIRVLEQRYAGKIKSLHTESMQGKGSAIRSALPLCGGDIILIQDSDLEYDIGDYPALLQPLLDSKADVVFGSRFKGSIKNMRTANWVVNKLLTFTANLLYRANLTDEATCYKVFQAGAIKKMNLTCRRFEFCPEVVAKIAKMKLRLVEVPVTYVARTPAEGKKIRWPDAFIAFWTLLKYRFCD
jgi:glycosyltransferase involved in cell wall biosynthesis